jgi:S-adenosylmethionine decarboxylase proenzyme
MATSSNGTQQRCNGSTSPAAAAAPETTAAKSEPNGKRDRSCSSIRRSSPFVIRVTLSFILGTIVVVSALAFAVGRMSLALYLRRQQQQTHAGAAAGLHGGGGASVRPDWTTQSTSTSMPPVFYSDGKEIPHTVYSSKNFATGTRASSDTLPARRASRGMNPDRDATVNADGSVVSTTTLSTGNQTTAANSSNHNNNKNGGEQEVHAPAGQHLLIDIKWVDGTFLNSEERLARAMIDVVEISGLTLLSYHCHGLEPVGVSCVGVLLESHISFHTWPIAGVITLDLFTCGPTSLLPVLPVVERLFAVPRRPVGHDFQEQVDERPHMQWAYKHRGFPSDPVDRNPDDVDMDQFMLGWIEYEMKNHMMHTQTEFQTVDIFQVINPRFRDLVSYKKSLKNNGSYEARNPELFAPEKILYLDGIMQSRQYGEAAYHEVRVRSKMTE